MVDGPSEAWVDGTSDAAATSSSSPKADEIQGIVAPTVLEFGSPDCPHCQEAEPKVKAAFQD